MEEKIKELLLEKTECEAIVLFGSYARGTQNSESDIDIAIKTKNKIDKKTLYKISIELSDKLEKDIDLINLDDEISDAFRYEILITGKTLYCEDEFKFEMYKLDMYREYLELNESRQMIIKRIKNGGDIYGK
jgi:putative toxin-antitoxin system, toxin component